MLPSLLLKEIIHYIVYETCEIKFYFLYLKNLLTLKPFQKYLKNILIIQFLTPYLC
jgi:hypothetical protein